MAKIFDTMNLGFGSFGSTTGRSRSASSEESTADSNGGRRAATIEGGSQSARVDAGIGSDPLTSSIGVASATTATSGATHSEASRTSEARTREGKLLTQADYATP